MKRQDKYYKEQLKNREEIERDMRRVRAEQERKVLKEKNKNKTKSEKKKTDA